MFELCEGQGSEGIFDRGAEDCEEGAQGKSGEEALGECIVWKGLVIMTATIA